ncbi:MAG TPA: homoserine O-acetyltransferase [Salinarimonas sp.]|nr:homoserine O-acetyltransferase [Salinarimonas sp.]
MKGWKAALVAVLGAWAGPALAQGADMIVEKRVFELPSLRTAGGRTLKNVRVGWEAYGKPNADLSNVILVTHFFSGTSHAAGKYAPGDKAPGYWDAIIGPGKAIDTDKYYVISSDTLVNLNANTPNVVTTGPASIDPDTGKPYGMTFPVVGMRDIVDVQKALVESLGVRRLKAVVGPSMGALQAYEWAVAHPDMVERIVPVIGAAGGHPMLSAWLDVWEQPIRLDPKWNGGDYYGREPPLQGLAAALKVVSLHANGWDWAEKTFGSAPIAEGRDPGQAMENRFRIVSTLDAAGAGRAAGADANHFLYLARANQLASADPAKIRTPALIIYSPTDLVFPPDWVERTTAAIKGNGTPVETMQITGPNGHLNGVLHMAPAGPRIAEFLAR